jgi:hypothetical protein
VSRHIQLLPCSIKHSLIASQAELLDLAAIWCRTGTSILPREGYSYIPVHCQHLTFLFVYCYFGQVYKGEIMDNQADDIRNHFYDLPTITKKHNHHVTPLGSSVCMINLPDLHKQANLPISPTSFIYPEELASNFSIFGHCPLCNLKT